MSVPLSVWNWENGEKLNYFTHLNHKDTKITSMDILNAHDIPLLMTGCGEFRDAPITKAVEWPTLSSSVPSLRVCSIRCMMNALCFARCLLTNI